MMSTPNTSAVPTNVGDLFNDLVNESLAAEAQGQPAPGAGGGSTKVANATGKVFDKAFFNKLASDDAEALNDMNEFVNSALEAGHSEEEISAAVQEMEEAANGDEAPAAGGDGDGAGDQGGDGDGQDPFDAAVAEAEEEAIDKAIDDELEANGLAKAAGINRETLEAFLVGQAAGEAYYDARTNAGALIEKIASQVLPSDDMITESIAHLKTAGVDVAAIEAEFNAFQKQASTQPAEDSAAVKKARELAQAEQAMVNSLTVLKVAGFDIDALVKQAEEKKKMSAGKKALIAGGTIAGLAGGGYLARKPLGAAMNYAKSTMRTAKDEVGRRARAARQSGS